MLSLLKASPVKGSPANDPRDLVRDTRGAAYVEFLLSFIPLFIMFLGMVQIAMMYAGDLVVRHAATTAARAAVVVLPDDPQYYDDSEVNVIDTDGAGSSEDALGGLLSLFGGGSGGGGSSVASTGGPRLSAIRSAASIPLMAISPNYDQLTGRESVEAALGGEPALRGATGVSLYNRAAMAVTFPTAPRQNEYRSEFGEGDQVTARVTYLFHCGIPVANRIMCETYPTLRLGPAAAAVEETIRRIGSGGMSFDEAREAIGRIDTARRRHEDAEPALDELEAAGASDLMYLTWMTGSRFKVLRAEATMPLQYARYEYP
ncbi:MAG: pilus assembly protein [Sandaracinaceae bacterium]|nr:pilus assembly protein [Sandaracinaceae bacterium]